MIHAQEASSNSVPSGTFRQGHRGNDPLASRRAAIRLNHEAVVLLRSGMDEEKAMDILKLGLGSVKSGISAAVSSAPNQLDQTSCSADRDRPSAPARQDYSQIVPVPVCTSNSCDDTFYLYANAFTFKRSTSEESHSPSLVEAEMLSATIIYNIALALHIKAIRTNCTTHQRRSLRLYEMSMGLINNMIMQQNENNDPSITPSCAMRLAIACSNNMALLAFVLCDFERSRDMLNTFQNLLSTSSASTNDQDFSLLFHDADIQGFKLNIMFMNPPTAAPAA